MIDGQLHHHEVLPVSARRDIADIFIASSLGYPNLASFEDFNGVKIDCPNMRKCTRIHDVTLTYWYWSLGTKFTKPMPLAVVLDVSS